MKNAIVALIAKVLDTLKVKNSLIFVIIQSVLIAVYVAVSEGIAEGLITDGSAMQQALEYLSLILMALIGTNTVTDLPENFDPGNLKEWLAKILDAFKAKHPMVYGVVQVVAITAFSVLTYGGLPIAGTLAVVLKAVTFLAIVLTGSRTVRYIVSPVQALEMKKGRTRADLMYYD